MVSPMDAEELVHDLPFLWPIRGILFAMGAFAIVMPTWELWRGVWPPSLLSLFFGGLIAGGWFVGFSALVAAFGASGKLVFRAGELVVHETYLRSSRMRVFPNSSISDISTRILNGSDGPDQWEVQIATTSGEVFRSRAFDTEMTAQKWAAEFRRVLGL